MRQCKYGAFTQHILHGNGMVHFMGIAGAWHGHFMAHNMGIAWALCGNGMVHDMPIGFWIAAYRYQMAGGRFLPCHKHFDTRIFNSKKMWQALKRESPEGERLWSTLVVNKSAQRFVHYY